MLKGICNLLKGICNPRKETLCKEPAPWAPFSFMVVHCVPAVRFKKRDQQ